MAGLLRFIAMTLCFSLNFFLTRYDDLLCCSLRQIIQVILIRGFLHGVPQRDCAAPLYGLVARMVLRAFVQMCRGGNLPSVPIVLHKKTTLFGVVFSDQWDLWKIRRS